MPIEDVINQEWFKFVARDPRLSRFDPSVLEGIRLVFAAGMSVGMRTTWQEMPVMLQPERAVCEN